MRYALVKIIDTDDEILLTNMLDEYDAQIPENTPVEEIAELVKTLFES